MITNAKIAIVFTAEILGGHELMAINHLKRFVKKGFDITCFSPTNNPKLINLLEVASLNFYSHNVLHKKMEIIHAFINLKYIYRSVCLLRKLRSEYDYIVIVQGDIELGAGFINASKILGMQKVVSYIPYTHSFKKMGSKAAFIKDFLSQFVYRNCCHYITICNTFSEQLIEKNGNATVRVLTNFVASPTESKQCPTVLEHFTEPKVFRLLVAGRVFFRQKGQDTLINALCRIKYSSAIQLDIIGDGPDLEKLKILAKKLPDNTVANFLGWKSNVWEFAKNIDVIIIPSNYEGVPLIMLEALKRNVPIIAPARDGMLDYIHTECLYSTGDPEFECQALSDKIDYFIDHKFKC